MPSVWRVGFTPSSQSAWSIEYVDVTASSIIDAVQIAVLKIGPARRITGIVMVEELAAWRDGTHG